MKKIEPLVGDVIKADPKLHSQPTLNLDFFLKINEIIDAINELIEFNQPNDEQRDQYHSALKAFVEKSAQVKCGKEEPDSEMPPCQGVLLPCEEPVWGLRHPYYAEPDQVVGQDKYWKCSICSREVR